MKTVTSAEDLRAQIRALRGSGTKIGFVPTMGSLHEGHRSLVQRSVEVCGLTVVSVFVNPTQFDRAEDLEKYPRRLEEDRRLLDAAGVDLLFTPGAQEMYPAEFQTWVSPGSLAEPLCGRSRPGHFRGVTTVVTKLFHLVEPDQAYFGQKDFQQARILQRMALDLDFAVKVRILPTVREKDGLACSSRNLRLTAQQRRVAPALHRALLEAGARFDAGERDPRRLIQAGRLALAQQPLLREDYFELRDDETLEEPARVGRSGVLAAAVFLGDVRLIDNLLLGEALKRLS